MTVKFSQIADGGAYVPATDVILAVRNGTTDVLLSDITVGPGSSTANHLASFSGTDGVTLADSAVAIANLLLLTGSQVITGAKTFTNSLLKLLGSSTGVTTFTSDNAGASNFTVHVPAANDTLAMLAAAQALTNKTLTLAAAQVGTFTASGVTPVSVSNATVTANSTIIITLKTVGGTVGACPAIQTITPTTGFTVAGTALDTSTYNYAIIG